MGELEELVQPNGLLPNGLLPSESASVIRVLDAERWSMAEGRTAELIARIQPNQPSEERRNAVADYVQQLIMKCFSCQVFTFGSVPLKTYLPDGDIDLTAFSKNQNLKDTWANQVRDVLESEEKNENAEFRVKEVQYIQAEVKIIKCLVENIVVDISFNQLGGLCTLCFLEEVDHLINQNHLFKRSIILIKAWCYYESRILGAHHGLISTYALETLVLYIFHVFNNSFAGPLEVLYRFLEFFSNFDWDNFCVSLWGPVPIGSLPDVTAEPPLKDSGELLLSKLFLDACSTVYAVFPGGQENQGQPFVSKHFNVIDPLRINNNLGRSVSKGNFFRIRSAFAFGAKRLARLLDCPKEDIVFELNQFFMNTWDRHGSGNRPDVPTIDLWNLRSPYSDHLHGLHNHRNNSSNKKINENSSGHEIEVEAPHSLRSLAAQRGSHPQESTPKTNEVAVSSRTHNQKIYGNPNSSRISGHTEKSNSYKGVPVNRGQRSSKPEHMMPEVQGKNLFARTRSSPELTDAYSDSSSQGRLNKPAESGKNQVTHARTDNSKRKNVVSETAPQSTMPSTDDPSSVRHISSTQSLDVSADINNGLNICHDASGIGAVGEEQVSFMRVHGMHQEEQDLVNKMPSSVHDFGGQVPMPLDSASLVPLPISQSMLASIGYAQRNLAGIVTANIPLIEAPWASNMQFAQGLISSPLTHYFPGIGLTSNLEDLIEQGNASFGSAEMSPRDADNDFWPERDGPSNEGFGPDDGSLEMLNTDDQQPSTSGSSNFVLSSRFGGSGSSMRSQQKFTKESRGFTGVELPETHEYQDNRVNEVYSDDRIASSRSLSVTQAGSLRSRASSESSWDGSSPKVSKLTREKRGRKTAAPAALSSVYGKGNSITEHTVEADDDNRDWPTVSTAGTEMTERSATSPSAAALHAPRHHLSGFEAAQTCGSDSLMPIGPMVLGPRSRQRVMDNSGVVPFTFYPTGPPVPFFTMLPVYNMHPETSTSDASSHLGAEDGLDYNGPGQNFDSPEGHDESEVLRASHSMRRATTAEPSEEHRSDILNSDFASHWQNLQYGRFCQNPPYHGTLIYQPSVVAPPAYLHGRFPWDGPGRPLAANVNMFSQLMGYGQHLVPVAPAQSVSNRLPNVYQYVDELPRHRSGTGTYLPNPKALVRDRHSSGTRRSNYNYDRNEHRGDREGNWYTNSKSRATGSSHSHSHADKSSSRLDKSTANESRADRPWGSYRHESISSYQSQNGPLRPKAPNSSQAASSNVAYGMYPLQGMNQSGVTSKGQTVPSMVMLYPYDHDNSRYGTPGEQLEFGSLGPVGFMGTATNEASQPAEGAQMRGGFEEQRFHGRSAQQSSPDQPSSPHLQRRM
ncbi:hypothetical protein Nepgr_002266 [Nepenthes gracilis]|uniref:Polymerase nucleotidyl transferase domain-containing protein n=1 Tax=Nepenthes gracilis TaxID=150966 RepID=A0AAD3P9S2_NEPGR|nr:hypothetical protein Nepgr_002266 [Nepenthes gracilis]